MENTEGGMFLFGMHAYIICYFYWRDSVCDSGGKKEN